MPDKVKAPPIGLQDLLDGETIADAAHRLGRDPLELFGAMLDAELRPEFERAEKLRAAAEAERERAERPRKPRRKSTKALIETAKRAGLAVIALNLDGSVATGEKAEGDALPGANGHSNPWDEVLNHADH